MGAAKLLHGHEGVAQGGAGADPFVRLPGQHALDQLHHALEISVLRQHLTVREGQPTGHPDTVHRLNLVQRLEHVLTALQWAHLVDTGWGRVGMEFQPQPLLLWGPHRTPHPSFQSALRLAQSSLVAMKSAHGNPDFQSCPGSDLVLSYCWEGHACSLP